MFIIKPAGIEDTRQIYDLANSGDEGMTCLPPSQAAIASIVAKSEPSFAGDLREGYRFLFKAVASDDPDKIVAITSIADPGEYPFLRLKGDKFEVEFVPPGTAELCSTLMDEAARKQHPGLARLLSMSRLLYIFNAQSDPNSPLHGIRSAFAELRGPLDGNGVPSYGSWFAEKLGRTFPELVRDIGTHGYRYALGENLDEWVESGMDLKDIPKAIRAQMGAAHPVSERARHLLAGAGFKPDPDPAFGIHDLGPHVRATRDDIYSWMNLRPIFAANITGGASPHILANTATGAGFRAATIPAIMEDGVLFADEAAMKALSVSSGDRVLHGEFLGAPQPKRAL